MLLLAGFLSGRFRSVTLTLVKIERHMKTVSLENTNEPRIFRPYLT